MDLGPESNDLTQLRAPRDGSKEVPLVPLLGLAGSVRNNKAQKEESETNDLAGMEQISVASEAPQKLRRHGSKPSQAEPTRAHAEVLGRTLKAQRK